MTVPGLSMDVYEYGAANGGCFVEFRAKRSKRREAFVFECRRAHRFDLCAFELRSALWCRLCARIELDRAQEQKQLDLIAEQDALFRAAAARMERDREAVSTPNPFAEDPFEVLGLSSEASFADVKARFTALALETHPDKARGDERKFCAFRTAYETSAWLLLLLLPQGLTRVRWMQ